MFTASKPSLEHDRKHVLRWLQLYGDQALEDLEYKFLPYKIGVLFKSLELACDVNGLIGL